MNGSRRSNAAAIPSSAAGRGTAGIAAAACRRWASAACMVNASSHLSRLRACRRSSRSVGRWIALMRQLARPQVVPRAHLGGQRVLARRPGSRARRRRAGRSSTRSAWRSPGRPGSAPWRTPRRAPWSAARRRRDREQLVLGVHQLAAAAEAGHRAGEQAERALLQLLRVEADAGEERELQLARAVGDDDLEPLLDGPPPVRALAARWPGHAARRSRWPWRPGRAR